MMMMMCVKLLGEFFYFKVTVRVHVCSKVEWIYDKRAKIASVQLRFSISSHI